jgi:hypothetical protein
MGNEIEFRIARTDPQSDLCAAAPGSHPIVPQLIDFYGNHTFFLDEEGLLIIEPVGPVRGGVPGARLVKLASWKNDEHNALSPHQPETTDVLVELARDAPLD